MSDDHSTDPVDEALNPSRIELSELPDDARSLAKRYAEQEKGSLTEKARHTLATFVRDPVEGLRLMDEMDSKVSDRIVKDLGLNSREELVNKLTNKGPSKDDIIEIVKNYNQETTVNQAKADIDSKMSQLPESVRDLARTEFADLTEGRNLSPEKLVQMAEKAVSLARVNSGVYEKSAKLNFGSQSMSGVHGDNATKTSNPLIDGSNDPFWKNLTK